MIKILIAEDERPIADLLAMNLERAGYACAWAEDGLRAIEMLEQENFDLALLDVMMPGADGYDVLNYLKPMQIPAIFITAKDSVSDRVKGLHEGADDYITKPFEIVEMLARVESVLRRYNKSAVHFSFHGVEVDLPSRTVTKNGVPVGLTMKEFDLLVLFLQNRNIALFRETLYRRVWGGDYTGEGRTVDLHVQRLRKKLGWEEHIIAVYKVGYRLNG